MSDLIDRHAAIDAIQKAYADTKGGEDRHAVWKNVGLTNALHIMQDLPSAQPQRTGRCKDCLMHGICKFEQGLGLDGYCSQWQKMEDSE